VDRCFGSTDLQELVYDWASRNVCCNSVADLVKWINNLNSSILPAIAIFGLLYVSIQGHHSNGTHGRNGVRDIRS